MHSTDRRAFIKTGIAATGAVAAFNLTARRIAAAPASPFKRVTYRELGSTGFKASELGFGAMNTRDKELIQAAIDNGINYIDTAHGYMNGQNEEIVGDVLKGQRDKVFLVTKVFHKNRTPKELREMMETSLRRLKTDYVDIMFMHMTHDRETALNDGYIKCFEQARKDGLCRFVGISTHNNHVESLDSAVESKFWEAVLVGYNYKSPQEVTDAIERARKAEIAIIAMKTQVKGAGYPNSGMANATINQAALKWVLENPYVDTTIPGMTAFDQLEEDLAVMGMRMGFNDHRELRRYGERNLDGTYCQGVAGCTGCQGQCPYGVDVCELNRVLGYAYGYGDMALARENYDRLPAGTKADMCGDCDECVVKCRNGLDLGETVRRTRALFA